MTLHCLSCHVHAYAIAANDACLHCCSHLFHRLDSVCLRRKHTSFKWRGALTFWGWAYFWEIAEYNLDLYMTSHYKMTCWSHIDLDEFLQKTAKKLEKIYGTARFDAINRAYADAVEKMGIIAGTLKTTAEKYCHSEPLESETPRMCLHNTWCTCTSK